MSEDRYLISAGSNLKRITNFNFWKDDNHAVELSGQMIETRLDYLHRNPLEALIVEEPELYLFSLA